MKKILFTMLMMGSLSLSAENFAVVDFSTCIQDSKFGKREQESFEALRNQLHAILSDTEKQMHETISKLQDQDYMDGLSPEGEKELKERAQALNEELNRYQSQYYQVMQQANMRLVQAMALQINKASESVAHKQKLAAVINREAAFYYVPKLDVTHQIVEQMDSNYETAKAENALPDTAQQMMMNNPKALLQPGAMGPNG